MVDKRREKRLEGLKAKADEAKELSPEEMVEQRVKSKVNLELSINTKKEEIVHLKEMADTGIIKLKDETYVDETMPMYKLKHVIATAKLQLLDYEAMLEGLIKLIEEDNK